MSLLSLLFVCWPLTDYCLVGALCGISQELGTLLQKLTHKYKIKNIVSLIKALPTWYFIMFVLIYCLM